MLMTIITHDGYNDDNVNDYNHNTDGDIDDKDEKDDNEDTDDDNDDNSNNDDTDNDTISGSSPDRSMARLPPIPSHLCCSLSKTGETTLFLTW